MNDITDKLLRYTTILIDVCFCILLPISAWAALFTPMFFDAPGSTENTITWILFITAASFPIVISISLQFSFKALKKKLHKQALLFSIIPLVNIAILFCLMKH